ncbi:MAG: glutathione synthase [bacterium]
MKKTRKEHLKMAFCMDPIENMDLETDTTFLIMMEAQNRGHKLMYFTPDRLEIEQGTPVARMAEARVKWPFKKSPSHYSLRKEKKTALEDMDLIFMRVDPPYNLDYVTALQTLSMVRPPALVINRPRGLLLANEKMLALRFPELMPPTIVTSDQNRIREFLEEAGGKIVIKPLPGFGGEGVVVVEKNHTNREALVQMMTESGKQAVLAQKFLPVNQRGDKRIIMLSGEPIGAVTRMPKKGDHRANLHSGGTYKKATLTEKDREICKKTGELLKREGLWIAGLDVVAGFLTEINVTSPTLIRQINELEGVKLEERILDFCEYLCRTARDSWG